MEIELIVARGTWNNMNDYLLGNERLGCFQHNGQQERISRKRYFKIAASLSFDPPKVGEKFSEQFRQQWTFGSFVFLADDESLAGWDGKHAWVRFIPRKPVPAGIRFYLLVGVTEKTGRPFIIGIWPDTFHVNMALGFKTVVDQALKLVQELYQSKFLPSPVSITFDSLFAFPDFAILGEVMHIQLSLALGKTHRFVELLSEGMKKGEYRVFQLGSLLLSIFIDQVAVTNISTVFVPTGASVSPQTNYPPPLRPLFADQDTNVLSQLSVPAMRLLAQLMLKSGSGSHRDVLANVTNHSRDAIDMIVSPPAAAAAPSDAISIAKEQLELVQEKMKETEDAKAKGFPQVSQLQRYLTKLDPSVKVKGKRKAQLVSLIAVRLKTLSSEAEMDSTAEESTPKNVVEEMETVETAAEHCLIIPTIEELKNQHPSKKKLQQAIREIDERVKTTDNKEKLAERLHKLLFKFSVNPEYRLEVLLQAGHRRC